MFAGVHGPCSSVFTVKFPAGNYMFKVNNRNTRTKCEICSKLTIKAPKQSHWRHSDGFIVNFEHILDIFLFFLLLSLSRKMSADFEWEFSIG